MKEKCSICKKEYHSNFFIESPYIDKDLHICECCADEKLGRCFSCDEWIDPEKSKYINYIYLCDDCYSKKVFTCKECGEKYYSDKTNSKICDHCQTKKDFLKFVENIPFDNIVSKEISFYSLKKTPTTVLMSRLRHCYGNINTEENKSPFDLLYITCLNRKYIVMWDIPHKIKQISKYECTMTEFKKSSLLYSDSYKLKICKTLPLNDHQDLSIFEYPFNLRAQTDANKNYGNRFCYHGGDLVDEEYGNQYGDTSDFCILGYIEEKH